MGTRGLSRSHQARLAQLPPRPSFREQLDALGFRTYNEYLASDHWTATRAAYKASGRLQECFLCGSVPFQLHHRSYARLGREKPRDFIPLCSGCHKALHDWMKQRAAAGTPTRLYMAAHYLRKYRTHEHQSVMTMRLQGVAPEKIAAAEAKRKANAAKKSGRKA